MTIGRLTGAMILGLFCLTHGGAAVAQTLEDRGYRVEFQRGQSSATIRDTLTGTERVVYRLTAQAGQTLDFKLTSNTRVVEFQLFAPGAWPSGRPMATSNVVGALVPDLNRYSGRVSASGDYRIVIRHIRNVATSALRSDFRLDLSIVGSAAGGGVATQLPGDSQVAGEPDYWRVSGLKPGDKLNMRSGPGTSFRVVDQLLQGEVVKNEGCTTTGGAMWCEVSRPNRPREVGWVSARYLAASSAPKPGSGQGATQLPGDALVGDTVFNATGRLTCVVGNRERQCNFGVVRRGRGNATLYIDLPSGIQRRIEFEGGRPVSSNSIGGIYGEFTGSGSTLVFIGTDERFTVNDAILFGG